MAIFDDRESLAALCRRWRVKKLSLFGSRLKGEARPDSDIDLLVDIAPDIGLFALGRMRSEAERILGSSVDIVPANSLKPDVAERALAEAISL